MKLLSCPFCGGEAFVRWTSGIQSVDCGSCEATVWADTEAEAIAAWNRRSEDRDAAMFEAGWRTAANYIADTVEREYMLAHIGCPEYVKTREAAIAAMQGEKP